ncbi:hypothetical protein BCV19_14600 [Vibrio splendidus]|uniref:Uncharacterized protein n=1 Tax=Vibrio splendidus TaxID=29497 RepID=A0A2N7CAZ9_VIBSP|nr:hypothetical protein BCV19_14600 [Vibrio splendidus]
MLQSWGVFDDPQIDGRVINIDTSLNAYLFDFTVAQLIINVITNSLKNDVGRKVTTCKFDSHSVGSGEF